MCAHHSFFLRAAKETHGLSEVVPKSRPQKYLFSDLLSLVCMWLTPSPCGHHRLALDTTLWSCSVKLVLRKYAVHRSHYLQWPKRLWATFNALLGRGRADRSSNPPSFTAEDYLASFQAKVQTIRDDTAGSPPPTFPSTTCILSAVTAITPAELRRIIIAAAPKSCELDPLPTFLLQEHLDILLPLLTTICNRSIVEGV